MKSNVSLPFSSSRLTVALVQVEGPLPHGKHLSLVEDRETFTWKSREEIRKRTEKARDIIQFLCENHQRPNLIVFPEYTIPLLPDTLKLLQTLSDGYGCVILPGADNIVEDSPGGIITKCPALIPGRQNPIWFGKCELSPWEVGYVDNAPEKNPFLTWRVGEQSYWFTVRICFDLLLAARDQIVHRPDPGLVIVPLYTPDIISFRAYSDILLRSRAGRAVALCNAIGGKSPGGSGIMAITPHGLGLKPAVELRENRESILVAEVDCARLSPPRKTPIPSESPIGTRRYYHITRSDNGVQISSAHVEEDAPVARAVINPALFSLAGKKLRLTFLEIGKFAEIAERAKGKQFEIIAVLGQHDLLISHLHQDASALVYDVSTIAEQRGYEYGTAREEEFPRFRVDTFYKVLGEPVTASDRDIFDHADSPQPRGDHLAMILRLAKNWDDESVSAASRQLFLDRRWILAKTTRNPGEIDAIMTIALAYSGVEMREPEENFKTHMLPRLIARTEITSIYGGTGTRIAVTYAIRITAPVKSLFDLIDDIHRMAKESRVLIRTSTSVVLRKLADLSLEEALLTLGWSPADARYLEKHVYPYLGEVDRSKFRQLTEEHQKRIVDWHRELDGGLSGIAKQAWMQEFVERVRVDLTKGLVRQNFQLMKYPHDHLQGRVEIVLSALVRHVSETDFQAWRRDLHIDHSKDHLSYTDKLKLVKQAIAMSTEGGRLPRGMAEDLSELQALAKIRNRFSHNEWEDLTMEESVNALSRYCIFLSRWDTLDERD